MAGLCSVHRIRDPNCGLCNVSLIGDLKTDKINVLDNIEGEINFDDLFKDYQLHPNCNENCRKTLSTGGRCNIHNAVVIPPEISDEEAEKFDREFLAKYGCSLISIGED